MHRTETQPDQIDNATSAIIARPRSQNNPPHGDEKHAPLHHPSDSSSLSPSLPPPSSPLPALLSDSLFLILPYPLTGMLTSRGLSWPDCQSVLDSDGARSIQQPVTDHRSDPLAPEDRAEARGTTAISPQILSNRVTAAAIKFSRESNCWRIENFACLATYTEELRPKV